MSKPKPSLNKYFEESAQVEITGCDPGFTGSWYKGTIIRIDRAESIARVEYETLRNENNVKKLLRENVELNQLRPVQPPDHHRVRFKIDDDVDAYCRGGWWEGIITGTVGSKFKVFFKSSRKQMAFEPSDLRIHREWVCGEWHPPVSMILGAMDVDFVDQEERPSSPSPDMQMQEAGAGSSSDERPSSRANGQISGARLEVPLPTAVQGEKEQNEFGFRSGDPIEAAMDGEGHEGAWFLGIVRECYDDGWFLVEYEGFLNDDNDKLTERVHGLHIRPRPPSVCQIDRFEKFEEVEAWWNGGWWEGEILKHLQNGKYLVYFGRTEDELKCLHKDLRVHLQWKDGKWAVPNKDLKL